MSLWCNRVMACAYNSFEGLDKNQTFILKFTEQPYIKDKHPNLNMCSCQGPYAAWKSTNNYKLCRDQKSRQAIISA